MFGTTASKTMPQISITITVGEELFQFSSYENWISKAQNWFKQSRATSSSTICVDAKGRICEYGMHFQRAKIDDAYPIKVYRKAIASQL